ncbi:protein phosphatase 1K, mitochondrial-like [Gigantopelta aegis]|uniref:protein phosphatase 1K, mitochondrial-like n=1 Tax=Gigantopelta aegis TaxID=1735272 RepID=UPI001B88BC5D|nr:protein phosphatase 1K, mitochondrial-like [Gigantopelta aegis]
MSLVLSQLLPKCRATVVSLHNSSMFDIHQHHNSNDLQLHSRRTFHNGLTRNQRAITDPENKGHHSRGVNFDTIGSWNNRLDMKILYDQSVKQGIPIPRIPIEEIGTASVIGRRKVNEDRSVMKELGPTLLYFAMFDGHGGAFAADFVSEYLHEYIANWLWKTTNLTDVLKFSFQDINNVMTRHLAHYHLNSDMFNTGTTATVCLLRDSTDLVVGHVGDSRAILCRSGHPIRLSFDDHPDNQEESARIKENGGKLVTNSLGEPKVNGRLAMTRSIGDCEMKQFGVTAKPHIKSIQVKHGKDAFLVLTTDGLNFVLSDQEVVDIIGSCENPTEAANLLTDQALHFGSEDNTTAMIIPFGAWGKYRNTTNTIQYSFGRNLSGNRFTHG